VPFALLQTVPQAPQLAVVVCVLVSQPLPALPSQLPKPALQVLMAQLPVLQVTEAFVREQLFTPQPPQ